MTLASRKRNTAAPSKGILRARRRARISTSTCWLSRPIPRSAPTATRVSPNAGPTSAARYPFTGSGRRKSRRENTRAIARARAWLEQHEPTLAKFVAGAQVLDFLKMKHFCYGSAQLFSEQRWSCVGEAGIFLDAFYSPGGDFIGHTNWITTRMIQLDRKGQLNKETADLFNQYMLEDMWKNFLPVYRGNYMLFDSADPKAGGRYTEPATADCAPVPGHALMARLVAR